MGNKISIHRAIFRFTLIPLLSSLACERRPQVGDDLALIPRETTLVIGLNMRRLVESKSFTLHEEEWNRIKTQILQSIGIENEDLRSSGIDPWQDLESITAAHMAGSGEAARSGISVIHGKFDENRIRATLRLRLWNSEGYSGKDIYHRKNISIGFLDRNRIALGQADAVRRAIDVSADRADSVKENGSLMKSIDEVRRRNIFWAAFTPSDPGLAMVNLVGQVLPLFTGIGWSSVAGTSFGANVGEDLEMQLVMLCSTKDQASKLNAYLNGAITVARVGMESAHQQGAVFKPEECFGTEAINSMHLELDESKLRMAFRVSMECMSRAVGAYRP